MAPIYQTPGVFIEEISTLPASIAGVATAIPAFIGYTEIADKDGITDKLKDIPTRIQSFPEFEELYGKPKNETIAVTVDDSGATRVITTTIASPSKYILNYAMRMYFANGGGPCYIVSVGTGYSSTSNADFERGLTAVSKEDEPTLIVMPEAATHFTATTGLKHIGLMSKSLDQCALLQDRFTIMDVIEQSGNSINQDAIDFRNGNLTLANLKYGAAYYPFIETSINFSFLETGVSIGVSGHTLSGVSGEQDYSTYNLEDIKDGKMTSGDDADLALYNQIKIELDKLRVKLPPSSSVAGIYARVDRTRGVWKAPANVSVSSVVAPNIKITKEEQMGLNVDAGSGKSINAIRAFTGKGTLVWGARTLAGNDNEWRYVPVRRLYIFVEESTKKASEFVVFEPNDANTWLRVKTMISNFLTDLWRDGALAGAVPADAFFVKVGLGETMTSQDILNGRLIVEIGLAAVRPAEFIILRFSHKLQES